MAITIQQTPTNYAPAYNPIWWVVSSTNTAQANFQYICDVYITGVTFAGGATYLRLICPADPTYGRGIFNIAPILRRQLTGDLGDTIYGFQQCSNSILNYDVKFGELYGPSSSVTAYPSLTNSTGRTSFNGSLGVLESRDYNSSLYVANVYTTPVSILSNAPSSGTIVTGYSQWVYAMSQTSGAIKYANITCYHSNNNDFLNIKVINHQYHDTTTIANKMIRFPAAYNVSLISVSDVVSVFYSGGPTTPAIALQDFLNTTINSRWEIYFTDTNHNRITESFYSRWNTLCTPHTIYQLYFKNKWGGYDTFDFIRASQISTSINRSNYKKVMGSFKSSSSYTYNDSDRYNTSFHTSYQENILINSDWITEDESVWLQELLTSPDIRTDIGTNFLVPINIIETEYIQRQAKTDKIFNLQIKIQVSFNEIRQGA